jgi:malate dehydrogenase (oxaloacetate-decarboxylating)
MIERELRIQSSDGWGAVGEIAPRIVLLDSKGLVHTGRDDIHDDQRAFAVDPGWFTAAGLTSMELGDPLAVAQAFRPTVLIGTTGRRGIFSRELVVIVASATARPVILPLSNPTDRAEAAAGDVLEWTSGRALVATGSPSADVSIHGTSRTIGQANNAFIFPGVGLGAIVAEARAIPDELFVVAAHALSTLVSHERRESGVLYPPVSQMRAGARAIAIATARHLRDKGYGRQLSDHEIPDAVDSMMWRPEYPPLMPA